MPFCSTLQDNMLGTLFCTDAASGTFLLIDNGVEIRHAHRAGRHADQRRIRLSVPAAQAAGDACRFRSRYSLCCMPSWSRAPCPRSCTPQRALPHRAPSRSNAWDIPQYIFRTPYRSPCPLWRFHSPHESRGRDIPWHRFRSPDTRNYRIWARRSAPS